MSLRHPTGKEHRTVDVEIPQDVHDIATRLGGGVPYALKAVAGQLVDDPDLGHPSGLPGILTVRIEDDMIEDCPALAIGYIREPEWIQIRFLTLARPAEPEPEPEPEPEEEPEERPDLVAEATTARQVADAWRRITGWLRDHAPDSYAALRPGAGLGTLAALEGELGIRLPVELRVLWTLTAGDDGGCLPGNRALMPVDAVAEVHRLKTDIQAGLDVDNAGLGEEDRITAWAPTRIPVVAFGPADTTSGLYLDAATGYLGHWSRYNEPPGEELDTLVTYLEETADMLEAPALATRDRPGLVGGTLVWLSGRHPTDEHHWQPVTG
ncbi:SMI1/KNR4 family protein [Streptomyces niveiscabiei]|uniref:Knr4/Smi1-like domain-containing protein n=1 Tax=Streptomyces niveiscabiei TaxID=164115 RepID=A0ABW9HJS3_9ACTN